MGITDVPLADTGFSPGGGQELHGPLGICHRDTIDPSHACFYEIHRSQHFPLDAGGSFRFLVMGDQLFGGFRLNDSPGRQHRGSASPAHAQELSTCRQVPFSHTAPALGQCSKDLL